MQGKTVIITGASDGIGAVAAQQLHTRGANVVVVGHSEEKTKRIAQPLGVSYFTVDYAKFEDVHKLAQELRQTCKSIDVLINNAGGIFRDRELTVDGHEKTLQVNYLSSFLLTNLLSDLLISSHASVINTASVASVRYGNIDINDLELVQHFSPNHAYGNSKLANILFTKELHRRYHEKGIATVAVHPGNIATNFASNTTSLLRFIYHAPLSKLLLESPEQGAEPLIWLASSRPDIDWKSGAYYEKHKLGKLNSQALDTRLAEDLWSASITMAGLV